MDTPFDSLKHLVKPGQDLTIFDRRLQSDHDAAEIRTRAEGRFHEGPPPEAQVVANLAKGTFGVAIKGARFVCELPKGYGGAGFELAALPNGCFVGIQPDRAALLINPHQGTTQRM